MSDITPADLAVLNQNQQGITELDLSELAEDVVFSYAITVRQAIKNLEAFKARIDDDLTKRFQRAEIDATFSHEDYSFSLVAGKTKWSYPESIKNMEKSLKSAKEAAQADGTAIRGSGAPYWTVRVGGND